MYYLRSTAAADAIKFTLDKTAMQTPFVVAETTASTATIAVAEPVVSMVNDSQQMLRYEQQAPSAEDYEQKRADMACSLDNPDACEACGS
jgi:ribonucleoside-diphosphate reductase alpha chain